jgi:hypothetical protein
MLTTFFDRFNLGPVTESEGNGAEEVKANKSPEAAPTSIQRTKRVSIKSIINIRDFELAAAQNLPAKSFACRLPNPPQI